MRQVRIEPALPRVVPLVTVRPLSISLPVESRIEKHWTQRRMKKHKHDRIRRQRLEEFEEKEQFRYEKSITRQKHHVDK